MSQLLNPVSIDSKEDVVSAPMSAELPIADYQDRPAEELFERIVVAKKSLGDQVLVLGHNYQRDEVIVHADLRGDSLLLSKLAAERSEFPHVVFCGVHFMAETADILSRSNQTVILPDLAAGCSMADMAAIEQVDTNAAPLYRSDFGVDPVSGHPLPKDSPYAIRHKPDCAINTPPYFPEQCNCGAVK